MRYAWLTGCLVLAGVLSCEAAFAGSYQENLSECLVEKSSRKDKEVLIEYSIISYSNYPSVKKYFRVPPGDREKVTKGVAALFQRLITKDCSVEIKKAIKYEGRGVLDSAFQTFGNIAGRELAKNPQVKNDIAAFAKFLDEKKLQEVLE